MEAEVIIVEITEEEQTEMVTRKVIIRMMIVITRIRDIRQSKMKMEKKVKEIMIMKKVDTEDVENIMIEEGVEKIVVEVIEEGDKEEEVTTATMIIQEIVK